jgi:hypothetical protein
MRVEAVFAHYDLPFVREMGSHFRCELRIMRMLELPKLESNLNALKILDR